MSQPQRELQLAELLRSLNRHRVEQVVFGAVAVGLYGYVRATEDLDIIVRPTEENLHRVHDWLVDVDAVLALKPERSFGARERWAMFKGENATVLTEFGKVDVVQRLPGLPEWDDLIGAAGIYEIEDLSVTVMARDTLIALKRNRSSPQDLADIDALNQLDQLDA